MNNSLVRLDVSESDLDSVTENITWVIRDNLVGNYANLFDQPGLQGMNLQPLNQERWEAVTGDKTSKLKVQLKNLPSRELAFRELTPNQFHLSGEYTRMDSSSFGADLSSLQQLIQSNKTD